MNADPKVVQLPATRSGGAVRKLLPPARDRAAADREFLPSALEVIETPSSPARVKVIALVGGLIVCSAALSYFGYISDYTSAPGKIQAIGRTKVIEPRAPGQVKSILVADGDRVKEGAALVELDPADAIASRTIIVDKLFSLRAEMARLRVEMASARADAIDVNASIVWEADIPADARTREESVLRADLSQLAATLANLAAQRKAAETLRDETAANIVAQNALLAVTSEHVDMNQTLQNEGWNSRLKVLDILEKLHKQQIALSALQGSLADAKAAIPVIDSEIAKTREKFVTNATQSLTLAERERDNLTQQLAKADQTLADMTLRSPLAGVIHAMAVTTIGQVVKPGLQLMQVVPEGVPLEIIGYVTNTNIGFVKVGQKVEIKLDTFPYATYGTIPGTVVSVGSDALPADATKDILQQASLNGDVAATTAAQKTGAIVFPITVEAGRSTMNVDGKLVTLTSGMAVTIDIKTEERRAIDYAASPLIELFTTAAHEQ